MSKENEFIKFLKKLSNEFPIKIQYIIKLNSNEKRLIEFEKYLKNINDEMQILSTLKTKKNQFNIDSKTNSLNPKQMLKTNSTNNLNNNKKNHISNLTKCPSPYKKEISIRINSSNNFQEKSINSNQINCNPKKEKNIAKKLDNRILKTNLINNKQRRNINTPDPLTKKKLNKTYNKLNELNNTINNIQNQNNSKLSKVQNIRYLNTEIEKKKQESKLSHIKVKTNNNITKKEKIKNHIKQSNTIQEKKVKILTMTKIIPETNKKKNLRSKTPLIIPSDKPALRIIKHFSDIKTIYRDVQPDDTEIKNELNFHMTINKDLSLNKIDIPSNKNKENEKILKYEQIQKEINEIINENGILFNDIYLNNSVQNSILPFDKSKIEINHIFTKYYNAIYYINEEYREIEYNIIFESKAEPNVYISKCSYPLDLVDDIENIELISFESPSKKVKCEIDKKQPLITFSELELFNEEKIELKFKVKGKRKNKLIFYIKDYFYISKSFYNAICDIKIKLENIIFVSSINHLFSINNDGIIFFKGKVPENGLQDILVFTKNEQKLKLNNEILFINKEEDKINKSSIISIEKPLNGDNNYYNIESTKIKIYQDNNFKECIENPFNQKDKIQIPLSNIKKEIKFDIESIIENKFVKIYKVPEEYNKIIISEEEKNFFSKISLEILENRKNNELIPVKLARWVNENIKYDINYLQLEKTSKEIYEEKKGVCSHKSQLYKTLLNSIGIPAINVGGYIIKEEEKKCAPHGWCLIKYKNNWCAIDPTWNIYSGYLPLSHIFCYYKNYSIQVTTNEGKTLEIQFSDNKIEYY